MTIKYTIIFHSTYGPPKFTQIWIFGLKIYHLATLPESRQTPTFSMTLHACMYIWESTYIGSFSEKQHYVLINPMDWLACEGCKWKHSSGADKFSFLVISVDLEIDKFNISISSSLLNRCTNANLSKCPNQKFRIPKLKGVWRMRWEGQREMSRAFIGLTFEAVVRFSEAFSRKDLRAIFFFTS
jgi:ferredoxin